MFQPSHQQQQRPMMPHQQFQNQPPFQNPYAPYQQPPFAHHHQQPMNGFMQQPFQQQAPGRPGRPRPPFPNMGAGNQPPGYKPNKPSFFKSAFTNESGNFDMGKTVSTVDQVVKTVHQASPIMKSIGSLFAKK
ncbi:YppG family protein [Alkalihalobacillus sp. MEB130]|uniref:YppG family protein n=1 Tax=Alkalihalobacillus sp. MEB130 TaxID=2976704 RepID=UPI0028DFD025|nr:YppG family protein [Alkalihalobacillus sp. MEB130]MDT8860588.1 YppG family protein [Alkalihalobacillus sp. MEB130]